MTKISFKTEELKAGDIISLQARNSRHQIIKDHEYTRLYVFEVTKRLFKTVVLFDATRSWAPGTIYNIQIIDLDTDRWVKLV